jgi:uncharacterized membrane protein YphA (DoxX/SURF4 family)
VVVQPGTLHPPFRVSFPDNDAPDYERLAAAALIVLFTGVTGLMLPMIGAPGGMGMAYVDQIVKNLAFIGGLVMLAVHGAGPVSLDARRERRVATR